MDTVVNVIVKTLGTNKLDAAEKSLNKVNNAVKKTNGALPVAGKGFAGMGSAAKGAGIGVRAFGKSLTAALGPIGAALAGVAGLTAAFNTIANQDFAVAKVKSLGVDATVLSDELKKVSAELDNSASVAQLTGAAYDVASAGFTDAADAAKVLKAASMGATGGFTELNTAGDALTSVLNAYGMSANEATATMDKFIQTQNDGKIVVDQYAQNIGKVASAAAGLGIPLEEINAIIAQSTASGVQAEVAFTGLKTAIARLASGDANKELEAFGVEITAASIEADGLGASLQKLVDAGLDTGAILKALGTEAGPALLPVLNNLEKFQELLENQKNSAGAAAAANKLATDTIQGAWQKLSNTISNFFTDQTAIGTLIKSVIEGINFEIKKFIFAVEAAAAPFKALYAIVVNLANGFKEAFNSEDGRKFAALIDYIGKEVMKVVEFVGERLANSWQAVLKIVVEVGKFIGTTLLKAIGGLVNGMANVFGWLPGIGEKIKGMADAWNNFNDQLKTSEVKTEKVVENIDEAKNRTLDLATAQKGVADEMVKVAEAAQLASQIQMKMFDAQLSLQQTLLDIEKEKAQRKLDEAKTFKEVEKAAENLYRLAVKQAALDFDIGKAKIDAAVAELKAKEKLVKATLAQAQAERAVLAAKGESTKSADAAIQKVVQQVTETEKLVVAQEAIAKIQTQQLDAIFDQTLETAKLTKEKQIQEGKERISKQLNESKSSELQRQTAEMQKQNSVLKQQQQIQVRSLELGKQTVQTVQGVSRTDLPAEVNKAIIDSGTKFLGYRAATVESNRLREESRKAAEGMSIFKEQMNDTNRDFKQIMSSVRNTVGDSAQWISGYAKEMYDKAKSASTSADKAATAINATATTAKKVYRQAYVMTKQETKEFQNRYGKPKSYVNRYASGGYVNTPTRAMIGEGGEGEYIVPESKMYEAMQRFGRGQRGESVVPSSANVNVNWSGDTIQMDGKNYVEQSQMPGLIQTAVTETMNTLHRNARARAFAGI